MGSCRTAQSGKHTACKKEVSNSMLEMLERSVFNEFGEHSIFHHPYNLKEKFIV